MHVEDRLRQPIPKGVQGGSAGQDPLTEPSQGVAVWYVACPLCRREAASAGLVQDHFEHEVWVVGEGPDPKVTCLQARPIQSVHESVDDAGAVIDVQRGVPSLPLRGAGRRGRGSKVAFLVTEFRLPSSSWPPCVTTLKSFAHHVRFAKIQGGHFSSPRRLSPPESWTFSARGGKGCHEIGMKAQLVQDQLFITPGPKPVRRLGRRLRLRRQPPRSWQLWNGGVQRGVFL